MSIFEGLRKKKPVLEIDSDDDIPKTVDIVCAQKIAFRCTEPAKKNVISGIFELDDGESEGGAEITKSVDEPSKKGVKKAKNDRKGRVNIPENILDDPELKQLMSMSILTPSFDTKPVEQVSLKSKGKAKKDRKEELKKTAGDSWFNMAATEVTDDNKHDLELLHMRGSLDPKTFYKKNDRKVLPKYFQIGKVVENKADYYSSRLTKKERKKTIVDEIMQDYKLIERTKKKYNEIKANKSKLKRLGTRKPLTMSKSKRRRQNKAK